MSNGWLKIFVVISLGIIVWLETSYPSPSEKMADRDTTLWNNGFCTCGYAWEYDRTNYYRGENVYYFRCKKCNDIIDLKTKVFVKK